MINTTIGKYKITRLIGEGGMATVYEAEHEMLGTKVAIKVLNPVLSANAQIKERFRNEAKLMASLDHPNITKVIDFDEQPHQLSIVMEYLNGEDLNQKIKRGGRLSEQEITAVFSQTLSAFQYAHEKGIVHRDIKPSNIFVLPSGHIKILDFGIAKLFGQGNEMTQTGTQMGTPIYMSPEQVRADKSIDHRSDIYSLGVTLYYSINGKPPYNSDTESQFDIFNKIVYEPLSEFSYPSNFKEIVLKACQKNREDRFQSCDDWKNALLEREIIEPQKPNTNLKINSSTSINEKTTTDEEPLHVKQASHSGQKKIYLITRFKEIFTIVPFSLTLWTVINIPNEWLHLNSLLYIIINAFAIFTILYISSFYKELIHSGYKKWVNNFRILASSFLIIYSYYIYHNSYSSEVLFCFLFFIVFMVIELLLGVDTQKKIKIENKYVKEQVGVAEKRLYVFTRAKQIYIMLLLGLNIITFLLVGRSYEFLHISPIAGALYGVFLIYSWYYFASQYKQLLTLGYSKWINNVRIVLSAIFFIYAFYNHYLSGLYGTPMFLKSLLIYLVLELIFSIYTLKKGSKLLSLK